MNWTDEGYLLSKNSYNENSIIIEAFTINHGKCSGIVYGGLSRKNKSNFQIANKIFLNWKSKGDNRLGYFTVELIKPIAPFYFDDKKRLACILSAASILKIVLPERQINKTIYNSFEKILNDLTHKEWIKLYINWEITLIKDLGFEINYNKSINKDIFIEINDKKFKVPKILMYEKFQKIYKTDVKEALMFNRNLLIENFILPNGLKIPLFRKILENYYS